MIKWWHNDSNIFLACPLYSDGEDSQCSWIQLVTLSRLWACALQLLSRLSIFLVIYDVAHYVLSKSRLPRKAELKEKKSKTKKLSNYRKSQAKYFSIGLMLVQVWCGKPPQKKSRCGFTASYLNEAFTIQRSKDHLHHRYLSGKPLNLPGIIYSGAVQVIYPFIPLVKLF